MAGPHITNGTVCLKYLPYAAQDALHTWISEHVTELDDVLAPHGLSASDIAMPIFGEVCTEERDGNHDPLSKLPAEEKEWWRD